MTDNLKLYVTPEDYQIFAGGDWPSYEDYLAGVQSSKPEINDEIANFTKMHLKEGVKFPINTATACQSKWTWSTIYLNQLSTASCHRVDPVPFSLAEFDNFHNIPKKLDDRRLMLKGEWPRGGCEYCKHIEDAGGHSDRQHNLEIRGLTPPELLTDPTAVVVTPKIVEIFAHNTCNLACIYCNGNLSSRIENENKKYGNFNKAGVSIPVITNPTVTSEEYFERFLTWLDSNVQTLSRLHLLGGETMIQHDLMNGVLNILEKHPNSNLTLNLFSNCNVPDTQWNKYVSKIKELQQAGNIKQFELTASIDCWGPAAEYVRSGLNLQKFEERLAWAAEQGDWLALNINQTITAMTIRSMPELIEIINRYNKHKHIGHYFELYIGSQQYQHPQNFAYSFWEEDFINIFNSMKDDTSNHQEAILRMKGIQQLLKQSKTHNYEEINNLKIYLDELDRRRNTNWREVFSYLDI